MRAKSYATPHTLFSMMLLPMPLITAACRFILLATDCL